MTMVSGEDGRLSRFQRSVQVNGLTLEVFGLGETWQGLGYKVTRLAMALEKYKDDVDKIILFSDVHDVLINGPAEQLVAKFRRFNARILFSAIVRRTRSTKYTGRGRWPCTLSTAASLA